jgi:hypothetical protein
MKRDEIVSSGGAHCDAGFVIGVIGVTFAVLGVVSDAMDIIIVLESISWLLLSIATCVIATVCFLAWALAVILQAIEVKK